jgi:hypothetical protein
VALSIVQARVVGLAHFSVGYIFTYAAFLIASTSGKFGSFSYFFLFFCTVSEPSSLLLMEREDPPF